MKFFFFFFPFEIKDLGCKQNGNADCSGLGSRVFHTKAVKKVSESLLTRRRRLDVIYKGMRPTLKEIQQSPLYGLAEANWLGPLTKGSKKGSKKRASPADVISEVYTHISKSSFDFSVLLSLEHLQYLEK